MAEVPASPPTGKTSVWLVLLLVGVAVGAGAFLYLRSKKSKPDKPEKT